MVVTPAPKTLLKCPRCGGADCDRIPRSSLVKMLLPNSVKHYKCAKCQKRFYKTA